MTATIDFQNVTKRYGTFTAISDVSFTVEAGETVALLGPSGCGKTTILRMIAGFEHPNEGLITIGGQPMAGLRPFERNVGLLFQNYALFPHLSVAQNIAYGLRHRGYASKDIPARVDEMLSLVRLTNLADRRPNQLSGGQQQRVALARALATKPSLLLLDEPLSALDAKLRHDLRVELKQVLSAVGSTVIVVTHDQEEAMSLGQRVLVMSHGQIMQVGTPNDVYWRPNSPFVAEFMGGVNWLSGQVERGSNGAQGFRTASGWFLPLATPDHDGPASALCVRPESIDLTLLSTGSTAPAGRVVEVVPLGPLRQITVEMAGGERLVACQTNRADHIPEIGQAVNVAIEPRACRLFSARV